jgi:hypothetical protein
MREEQAVTPSGGAVKIWTWHGIGYVKHITQNRFALLNEPKHSESNFCVLKYPI